MLFGLAALLVSREKPEYSDRIKGGTETIQAIVMRLVKMIMGLTPYGILSLVIAIAAGWLASAVFRMLRS